MSWIRHIARTALLGLLVVGGAAACLDGGTTTGLVPESLWEGDLLPYSTGPGAELPEVTGSVAVVVFSETSRLGMGLEGVDRELHWALLRGTCAEAGEPVLALELFPTIYAGADDVQYRVSAVLRSGRSYHVRIAAAADLSQLVACGDLVESDAANVS